MMQRHAFFLRLSTAGCAVSVLLGTACGPGPRSGLDLLRQDALGTLRITTNPRTGTPSFVRAAVPLAPLDLTAGTPETWGLGFLMRYAEAFGIDARENLRFVGERRDALGMHHVTFAQSYRGVDVYGARATVHLSPDGRRVVAVTNGMVPHVSVPTTRSRIRADAALRTARRDMPAGRLVSSSLAVYPGPERRSSGRLAWLVELRDDTAPARRVYVVSASTGRLLHVIDRLYIARDRRTYTANHKFDLPGTLRRAEPDGPVGDADVDRVHDFAGESYDYYSGTHGRDSYDNLGATITSTAHYRANYQNAFWNGQQMAYGDGFVVKDVVAHELTHAVTEYSADLEYRWQSGALNESYSDIFAAMIDRGDWLIGEDLPNGPIRNMANPEELNDPGHVRDWRTVCSDNEGVHTNSGIHNKAYVNVAEAIGKDVAERIFYRALTVYLGPQSSFEDSRSAALQSAADLFGEGSAAYQAVDQGFAGVGIDGSFDPGPGGCGGSDEDSPEALWAALAFLTGLIGLAGTLRRSFWR